MGLIDRLIKQRNGKLRGGLARRAFGFWVPYRAAGVSVRLISDDWMSIDVEMALSWYNRNFVGTQFGGSLFAMSDPWWMLMLMQQLGPDYVVWDKAAEIDFVSPGKGRVYASFRLEQQIVDQIIAQAKDGAKVLHWFKNQVVDSDGNVVATINKQVYIRQKRRKAGI